MPARPLLIFPRPSQVERDPLPAAAPQGGPRRGTWQAGHVAKPLRELAESLRRRNLELSTDAWSAVPEEVLVLETIGDVSDFVGAVRRVVGLEWLVSADFDEDQDNDGDLDDGMPPSNRLFALSTNLTALEQLLSLWRRSQEGRQLPFGLRAWQGVFDQLREVRTWSVGDRLDGTGIVAFWQDALELGDQAIEFAVEFWYRSSEARRREAFTSLEALARSLGGQLDRRFDHAETAFHGAIALLPPAAVRTFLETPEAAEFLKQPQIKFCRPHGQAASLLIPADVEDLAPPSEVGELTEPVAALFDGLPVENHRAYAGWLRVDDPDNWAEIHSVADRQHGTAMASLIVRGDLGEADQPLASSVYVRPILRPDPLDWTRPRAERVPGDWFPQDLLNIAVRRLKMGAPGQAPAAGSVLVVNLSVGDPSRCFIGEMSPWARMVDFLSYKHNLLFIVSAGNHPTLPMNSSLTQWEGLSALGQEEAVVKACWANVASRRLLSPAESMNALTVGAQHLDSGGPAPAPTALGSVPIQNPALASPTSALGPGYRRSVKPDVLFPGGRQVMTLNPNATLTCAPSSRAPGQRVATPGGNAASASAYSRGSSNAAALATRHAVRVVEVLRSIRQDDGVPIPSRFLPVLAKALLGHGASAAATAQRLREILTAEAGRLDQFRRRWVMPMVGYGPVESERSLGGDDNRATLVGWGELSDDGAHEFRFPMPPSLNAVTDRRRLTTTLAWFSPINASSRIYRSARLWLTTPDARLNTERAEAEWRTVRNGTLQHEIFEGDAAGVFAEGDEVAIRVNCKADGATLPEPIRYGLAVSIESSNALPIYEEVRSAIALRTRIVAS